MNDRTLVKLRCNKEMLDIRTVSWTRKSPYSFSIFEKRTPAAGATATKPADFR